MKDNGHGDTIKKIRTREELRKLHLEDRNSQTRLDLSEFDFRNEQYLDNLLTCYGQYGKNYTLKEVYLSDTILKVKVEIVEYEKAGWSDAHTPSQEWAYARETRREVMFESMDDYDRKDYLGLGYDAKLIIVPHVQHPWEMKQSEPKKDPLETLEQMTPEERKSLTKLSMSGADTSGMKSMRRMFSGFESLKELKLSSFDTHNVENMEEMFRECKCLHRMDLSRFDFTKVESMDGMFSGCYNLQEVILSDTILKAPLWLMISNPTPRYGPGSDMPDIIGGSFGEASYNEQCDYLGLLRDVKLTIVPHGGGNRSAEKAPPQPEKPKPAEPVKAPVQPTPAPAPQLSPAPKPDEPAEKPNPPQPIPQHVLDAIMEENRRREQKTINFWSWMIVVVAFIVALLITMRT